MADNPGRAFGLNVDNYQGFRPRPPEEIFDIIAGAVGENRCHAIDLGAGTGHATAPLMSRFDKVTAVEVDPGMAEALGSLGSELEILVAPAEGVSFPAGSLDLVCSAMSFHWMDRELVAEKVAGWLRPGGLFALYGYGSLKFPDAPTLHDLIENEKHTRWTHFFPHEVHKIPHEEILAKVPVFNLTTAHVPHFVPMTPEDLTGHMASTSSGGAWARSTGNVTGYWDDFLARLKALDMIWPTQVDFSKEIILAQKKL